MNVSVDHIANRFRGDTANGAKQPVALARTAAGVDHGHRVVTDDEAEIGGIALVFLAHHRDIADMDVNARRNFGNRQRRRWSLLLCTAVAWNKNKNKKHGQYTAH